MFQGIDLYSDTVTRPSAAMKRAMIEAEVGDEQKEEDPTTHRLEKRVAELLGKRDAMFFPSATMANEVAIIVHCERGDEIICAENAHIMFAEGGGPALWAGALMRPIETESGVFTGEDVRRKNTGARGPHYPLTKLVVVENTTNMGGGIVWPIERLESVWKASKELGLRTHLDGSRFFNAVVASKQSPARLAAGFDSITICLSKGLGCAAGAVLAFESLARATVRRWKQRMGGSLRQSGMLAAAGLYALDNHIEQLAEDHSNARRLAEGLNGLNGIDVENTKPDTNMVFFRFRSAKVSIEEFRERCEAGGFRFSRVGADRFRAVTHRDISNADIDKVIRQMAEIAHTL